jgi:membrane protease YdiL (CAAX protease family)
VVLTLAQFLAELIWLAAFSEKGGGERGVILPAQIYVGVFLFPLVEEFAFRGWIQLTGQRRLSPFLSMVVASLLFAALHSHGDWLPRINAGLVLGAAVLVTRCIWIPVLMHILFNFSLYLPACRRPFQKRWTRCPVPTPIGSCHGHGDSTAPCSQWLLVLRCSAAAVCGRSDRHLRPYKRFSYNRPLAASSARG